MMPRRDDPEKMARMRSWLVEVCEEVSVDPRIIEDVETPMLQLISQIAHGPSRPGAPLTMFVLGLAAGRGADVSDLIERVSNLAAQHENTADPTD